MLEFLALGISTYILYLQLLYFHVPF